MQPVRRDLDFGLDQLSADDVGRWHPLGSQVSQFYNALSLFFPDGERFFIHSVRLFREQIDDPELQRAITAFIGQEALHGREHVQYNDRLRAAGLPAATLEAEVHGLLEWLKRTLPPSSQLAVTLALEHFTAMLSHLLLTEPALLDGAEPKLRALWRWHAIEETEHKGVAFDVYTAAVGRGPKAYAIRSGALLIVLPLFLLNVLGVEARLLLADGQPRGVRSWLNFARFIGGKPGLLRRMIKPGLDYLRPGFHPWDQDNRALLDEVHELIARYGKTTPARMAA